MISKFQQRLKRWDDFMKKHTQKAIESDDSNSSFPDIANDPVYRDADDKYKNIQSALSMLCEEDNKDLSNDHDNLCIQDYISDCENIPEDDAVIETSSPETQLQKSLPRSFIIDDCDSDETDTLVEDENDCEQTDSDYDSYQDSASLVTVIKSVGSSKLPKGKMLESLNQNSKKHLQDQSTSVICPNLKSNVLREIKENSSQSHLPKSDCTPRRRLENRETSTSPITFGSPLFSSTQTLDIRNSTIRESPAQGHAAQSSTPIRFRQSFSNQYGKWGLSPKRTKTDHNPVELPIISSPGSTYMSSVKTCSPKSRGRSAASIDDMIISDEPVTSQAIVDLMRTPPARLRRKRVGTDARNKSKLRLSNSKHAKRLEYTSSKQLRHEVLVLSSDEEHQGCVFDEKEHLNQDTVKRWLDATESFHSTDIPGVLSVDGHLSSSNHLSDVDDKSSITVNINDESKSDCEENACPGNYEWSWEQRHHFTSWWLNATNNDDRYSDICDNSSPDFDPFITCESGENCPLRGAFGQSSSMTPSVVQEELQEQINNIDVLFGGQELLCLSSKSAKSEKRISPDLPKKRRFFLVKK